MSLESFLEQNLPKSLYDKLKNTLKDWHGIYKQDSAASYGINLSSFEVGSMIRAVKEIVKSSEDDDKEMSVHIINLFKETIKTYEDGKLPLKSLEILETEIEKYRAIRPNKYQELLTQKMDELNTHLKKKSSKVTKKLVELETLIMRISEESVELETLIERIKYDKKYKIGIEKDVIIAVTREMDGVNEDTLSNLILICRNQKIPPESIVITFNKKENKTIISLRTQETEHTQKLNELFTRCKLNCTLQENTLSFNEENLNAKSMERILQANNQAQSTLAQESSNHPSANIFIPKKSEPLISTISNETSKKPEQRTSSKASSKDIQGKENSKPLQSPIKDKEPKRSTHTEQESDLQVTQKIKEKKIDIRLEINDESVDARIIGHLTNKLHLIFRDEKNRPESIQIKFENGSVSIHTSDKKSIQKLNKLFKSCNANCKVQGNILTFDKNQLTETFFVSLTLFSMEESDAREMSRIKLGSLRTFLPHHTSEKQKTVVSQANSENTVPTPSTKASPQDPKINEKNTTPKHET